MVLTLSYSSTFRVCSFIRHQGLSFESFKPGTGEHVQRRPFFDRIKKQVQPEGIARNVPGDNDVEMMLFRLFPMVLGHVHADDRADAGLGQFLNAYPLSPTFLRSCPRKSCPAVGRQILTRMRGPALFLIAS